jgi:hypothetical protein
VGADREADIVYFHRNPYPLKPYARKIFWAKKSEDATVSQIGLSNRRRQMNDETGVCYSAAAKTLIRAPPKADT